VNSEKMVLLVIVNDADSMNATCCGCTDYITIASLNRSGDCRVGYTEEAGHEKVGKSNQTCPHKNPGYENSDC